MRVMMRDGSGAREFKYIWEDTDRHGNVRVYFARSGGKKVRLNEKPGTEAFEQEYQRAINDVAATTEAKSASQQPPAPGSLRWLVRLYYGSDSFLDLSPDTQTVRKRIVDAICVRHGHKPFRGMQPRDVVRIRDEKRDAPEAANSRVKALRQLFRFATDPENNYADFNPTRDVRYLRPKNPDGHHTWTIEEIKRFQTKYPVGTKPRLALDLMLYTGVRKSDAVMLGPQMVKKEWLRFTETKNARRRPKHREIPVLPILRTTISQSPSGHLTFLITQFGKPYSVKGFGNRFKAWCVAAGLPHCSAHGLRKAGATFAAENGATHEQLMALFGWTSSKQPDLYTKKANRKKIAGGAMSLIAFDDAGDDE
jgi:integrase